MGTLMLSLGDGWLITGFLGNPVFVLAIRIDASALLASWSASVCGLSQAHADQAR
jgi:hypothetical protein